MPKASSCTAFPLFNPPLSGATSTGLSKREYYATAALEAVIIASGKFNDGGLVKPKDAAKQARQFADALTQELEKVGEE